MRDCIDRLLFNPGVEVKPARIMQRSGLHEGSASALQLIQARRRVEECFLQYGQGTMARARIAPFSQDLKIVRNSCGVECNT